MAKPRYPSEKLDQYMLRLPDGMRDRIKAAAETNNRSMNAEIVATLEEKYPEPQKPSFLDMMLEILDRRYEGAPDEVFERAQQTKRYLLSLTQDRAEELARGMAEQFFTTLRESGAPPPLRNQAADADDRPPRRRPKRTIEI